MAELRLIALHVTSVVHLAERRVPAMVERGGLHAVGQYY